MEFWLFLPQMRMSFDQLVTRARAAEAAGFGGIAFMDHLEPPLARGRPMYDAMTTATWVAAHTTTLGIGHLVLCDAFRKPAVLAQQCVTLDHASGGRFELGIGAGSAPDELDVYGVEPRAAAARVARLGETLEVLEALWTGEKVTYRGEYHQIVDGQQLPVPTRPIPIVIGASRPKMMALVAKHATWWNLPVHQIRKLHELRASAGSARASVQQMVTFVGDEATRAETIAKAEGRLGRMGGITGSTTELIDQFGALPEAGVERVYAWFTDFAPPDTLTGFGEVIAALA